MKKKILSILLVTVIVMTIVITPLSTFTASAASYPSVMLKSIGMTVYCGDTVPLIFTYIPAYNNERVTINIYSQNGVLMANSVFNISNKYNNYRSLTTKWDTDGYKPGTYKIEIIKEFYSYYSWHTTPTNGSASVTLVEPSSTTCLNNAYNGNETHFEVRNDSSVVTASNKNIKSAYNGWQKLRVANVSNPYEIQLTEMYIGDEAEDIAVEENMFNANGNSLCQWVLTKFEIKNNGSSTLKASETIDWIGAYLPTGEDATLIDICTFGDLPNYDTEIQPGETIEAWFGFYLLKSQGIPFLKLDNGVYISTHPDCSKGHKYSEQCDDSCDVCHGIRNVSHAYKTTTTKATTSKNGSVVKACSVCGKQASKTTIYYAKKVKLSTTEYTYNGKAKKPTVTVYDSKGKKISSSHYDVSYASGRKNVGKYKVTIKLKGNYSGTLTAYFTIVPKESKVSSLTAGKKSLKVKISKVSSQASGYEIQYSTSSKFSSKYTKTKKVTSYKTTSVTLKSLKAKKTYYVRVRTYKTVDGKKYYSDWSSKKSKKTK